ncbi:hypothetical protein BDR07DRAFT_1497918 [Suillus spraguei]|nr:hypothetical protein BDR07DRAFT_1497918 [Suillus spraguei]
MATAYSGTAKPSTASLAPAPLCVYVARSRLADSSCILLAEASLWLPVAMLLAVFDISKAVESSIKINPEVDPLRA